MGIVFEEDVAGESIEPNCSGTGSSSISGYKSENEVDDVVDIF